MTVHPKTASLASRDRPDLGTNPQSIGVNSPQVLLAALRRCNDTLARLTDQNSPAWVQAKQARECCDSLLVFVALLMRHLPDGERGGEEQVDEDLPERRGSWKTAATLAAASAEQSSADAVEAARLDGVLLAARTAAHLINNDLTSAIGLDQIAERRIRRGEPVDPHLLKNAVVCAMRAGRHLQELQEITHLEIEPSEGDTLPILDLERSRGPIHRPTSTDQKRLLD